jgi:peptidoglycan/xylan/chitin deacetylase (PgdA/CDA1 family)
MLNPFRMLAVVLMLIACVLASPAQQRSVAITFDDLPAAGTTDLTEVRSLNMSILTALDRYHAPTTGFVIESRVQEIGKAQGLELLGQWVSRGYELGNHTLSHADSNSLTVEQFQQEIVAGETSFAAAMAKVGKTPRYFRFPQNHTGDTKDKHDAIAAFLQRRGYTLAVCTIDTEDFVFNEAYLKMLAKKDEASVSRLRADYLAYTSTEIDYYTDLHKRVFGRDIPHVMLLHVNQLNADVIDKLLDIFVEKHYTFISLGSALSDAAYKTPDTDVTKYGPMWGYRWARELRVQVNGALETEPPAWVVEYDKSH